MPMQCHETKNGYFQCSIAGNQKNMTVTVTSGLSKAIHGLLHFTFDSRLSVFGKII